MTKDERFLLEIHRMSATHTEKLAWPAAVGQTLGYSPHQIKNILIGLMKANFVKGNMEEGVYLTPQGLKLVEILLK